MRVADFIATTLAQYGIKHVFLVTGGGAMHLNDAIGRCKELSWTCCHHEQACAMAAESYFRLTNRLAVVNVTSGPGGTNAITGVYGAFVDSLGMVVISGQVKYETLARSTALPLRQMGDQELDIVPMVKPITKYAEMVTDPQTIRYHLEKALYLATAGRPGPVWLDIPLDVQGAQVDPQTMRAYDPAEDASVFETADLDATCREIAKRISNAERPVVMVGAGVRIGDAQQRLIQLLDRWRIPVVTCWNAHDLVHDSHPSFAGRPGSIGNRPGNFAVQNADLILVLGSRLNIRQVSYAWKYFARHAYKIMVDIDAAELRKPTIIPDLPVHAHVSEVIDRLLTLPNTGASKHATWLAWCREKLARYPACLPEYWTAQSPVNPYCFASQLFDSLPEDEVVVTGDGSACVVTFQAARIKSGQRLYTNSGCAAMGYDLPAAIGACVGNNGKRVICLAGDGSIQLNLQELQTIVGYKLPIKIFVLNNLGYHSIRQTQINFFPDNLIGFDTASGVHFADMSKLAVAFGIPFRRCADIANLKTDINETLDGDGPQMCEVMLDHSQTFSPKVSSKRLPDGKMVSAPLEDMYPFLPRDEFAQNMLVPILGET